MLSMEILWSTSHCGATEAWEVKAAKSEIIKKTNTLFAISFSNIDVSGAK